MNKQNSLQLFALILRSVILRIKRSHGGGLENVKSKYIESQVKLENKLILKNKSKSPYYLQLKRKSELQEEGTK